MEENNREYVLEKRKEMYTEAAVFKISVLEIEISDFLQKIDELERKQIVINHNRELFIKLVKHPFVRVPKNLIK